MSYELRDMMKKKINEKIDEEFGHFTAGRDRDLWSAGCRAGRVQMAMLIRDHVLSDAMKALYGEE